MRLIRALDFRRGALIEGGEPQAGLLPNVELIDVRRRNLGLDRQLVSLRHDQHQGIGRAHHAADRVTLS